MKAFPKSPTPYIVTAILMKDQAESLAQLAGNATLAGTGVLQDRALKVFMARVADADKFLVDHDALLRDDPYYPVIRLQTAALAGSSPEGLARLFEELRKRQPGNFDLYELAMLQQVEAWRFNSGLIDAFIRGAADASKASDGDAFYVNLYWSLSANLYKWRLFEFSSIDWARMRRGMADMVARYPGPYNANRYALLSCLAGDADTAKAMFSEMHGLPDPDVWQSAQALSQCWHWANSGTGQPLGRLAEFREGL